MACAAQELRVIVATDVLSEGQNLQDAAIVVNYDLPWTITPLSRFARFHQARSLRFPGLCPHF